MTTKLNKPVSRMTDAMVRSTGKKKLRRLVATLMPTAAGDLILLRPEGTRESIPINILDVWSMAMKQKARRLIEERKAKRKAAKGT